MWYTSSNASSYVSCYVTTSLHYQCDSLGILLGWAEEGLLCHFIFLYNSIHLHVLWFLAKRHSISFTLQTHSCENFADSNRFSAKLLCVINYYDYCPPVKLRHLCDTSVTPKQPLGNRDPLCESMIGAGFDKNFSMWSY